MDSSPSIPEVSPEPTKRARRKRARRMLKEPRIVKHRTVYTDLVGALRQYLYLEQVDDRAPRGTPDEIAKWYAPVERTLQARKKLRAACRAVMRVTA